MPEGTKELMPLDTNHGKIQIFDHKRPFAAFYNTEFFSQVILPYKEYK